MKARLTLTAVLLAGIAVAVYLGWPASPQRAVLKQLDRLQEAISKRSDEGGASLAAKTLGLEALFTAPCQLEVGPINGRFEPEDLSSLAMRYRASCRTISLNFSSMKVVIEGAQAAADFTANLSVTDASGGRSDDERQLHVVFALQKRTWLITRMVELNPKAGRANEP